MPVEEIALELIDDNPYQPRSSYPRNKIDELAYSIEQVGLIHKPLARRVNGRFQIAEGHLRKRALLKLQKKSPKKWTTMPLDIRDIPDEQMALISLEENLRRHDITPMDTARAVESYLTNFTDTTETALAKKMNLTQGHIANMRRVLKLPDKILEKIDEGKISFTMGRELLIFQGLNAGAFGRWSSKENRQVQKPKDEEYLMLEAVRGIGSQGSYPSTPATVEGIKRSIHSVAKDNFKALEKGGTWRHDAEPLFDTRAAGCLKCKDMIRTFETKTQACHYCTNPKCWEKLQAAHKKKQATAAKKKMQEDIAARVLAEQQQRAAVAEPTVESISQEIPVETEPESIEDAEDIVSIIPEEQREHARERIAKLRGAGGNYPCITCLEVGHCDGTGVHDTDNKGLVCDEYMGKADVGKVREKATVKMPAEFEELVKEKAGTRAVVLDLRELRSGNYGDLKQGYVSLDRMFEIMEDPEECVERCTKGFHYAFDSDPHRGYGYDRESKAEVCYVCTDPKCVSKKKGAFTRAKNARGMAKKKAEFAAIKRAVEETTILDTARLKLLLLAQMEGSHVRENYTWSDNTQVQWFASRLPIAAGEKKVKAIFDEIDKLGAEDLCKLLVEFSLSMLTYEGEVNDYKVQTTEPLNWLGIGINLEAKKEG